MFFITANALWTWLVFGKEELLSWRGLLGVVVPSALFFLMTLWATPSMKSSEDEDEKYSTPVESPHGE